MKVWPFMPQVGPTESLEWLTDLIETKGGDQRLALRSQPRVAIQYKYIMDPVQFSRARALAKTLGAEELLVPVWTELSEAAGLTLGQTVLPVVTEFKRYKVGDSLLLWQDEETFEAVVIQEVGATDITLTTGIQRSYSSCVIFPALIGWFSSPLTVTRANREEVLSGATFRFTLPLAFPDPDAGTTYRGFDVVTERTHLVANIREVFEREFSLVDYQLGQITQVKDRTSPIQTSVLSWQLLSRAELWDVRRWLYAQRGKFGSFWMPSWNKDLQLVSSIAPTDTTITIQKRQYADVLGQQDVIVVTSAGDVVTFRVLSWETVGLNEVGTLEAVAGFTLDMGDVVYIGWITLMRFNADRVEIKYGNAQGCTISIPVKEVLGQ